RTPTYPYMVRLRATAGRSDAERRISDFIGTPIHLRSVHEEYVRSVRPILTTVAAAAGIVLLIACANVAFLMLIRSNRRQRDLAIRFALGAQPGRVAGLVFAESFLLCGAAMIIGTTVAAIALKPLGSVIQQQLGRPVPGGISALSMTLPVVAILALVCGAMATMFAFMPLIASRRHQLITVMNRGKRSGLETSGGRRGRSVLIAFEIAASLALLVGCGLMARTLIRELNVDL